MRALCPFGHACSGKRARKVAESWVLFAAQKDVEDVVDLEEEVLEVGSSRFHSLELFVFVDTGLGVWFVVCAVFLSRSRRLSFSCAAVVLAALAVVDPVKE